MKRKLFFPVVLPLLDLVLPLLLTLVGGAAAAAQLLTRRLPWLIRWQGALGLVGGLLLISGALTLMWRMNAETLPDGVDSQAVEAALWPAPRPIPPEEAPPARTGGGEGGWARRLPRQGLSTPAVGQGLILLGTLEGALDALSLDDGAPRWSLDLRAPILAQPLIEGDVAFVSTGLHQTPTATVTALRLPGGEVLWQRAFRGHIEERMELDPATRRLFVAAGPAGVFCLSADTGEVLWRAPIGHVDGSPTLTSDALLVSAGLGGEEAGSALFRLRPQDGEALDPVALPGMPWGSPRVAPGDGDLVVVSTGLGQLGGVKPTDRGWAHGISLDDGRVAWTRDLGGMPMLAAAILPEAGLAIFTVETGAIHALGMLDGEPAWTRRYPGGFESPAVVVTGAGRPLVAATTNDGRSALLDPGDGRELATTWLPGAPTSSPVEAPGGLVLTSSDVVQFEPWPPQLMKEGAP